MKVLILGSSKKENVKDFKNESELLGKVLAEKNHTIITGGGDGVFELIHRSYKLNKGKKYIVYLPSKKEMKRCNGEVGPKPDKTIYTGLDYPERNLKMIKKCDYAIAVGGGIFTFTEIIHTVKDYNKKVCIIDKGKLALWIKSIDKIRNKILFTKDIIKAIHYFEINKKNNK